MNFADKEDQVIQYAGLILSKNDFDMLAKNMPAGSGRDTGIITESSTHPNYKYSTEAVNNSNKTPDGKNGKMIDLKSAKQNERRKRKKCSEDSGSPDVNNDDDFVEAIREANKQSTEADAKMKALLYFASSQTMSKKKKKATTMLAKIAGLSSDEDSDKIDNDYDIN